MRASLVVLLLPLPVSAGTLLSHLPYKAAVLHCRLPFATACVTRDTHPSVCGLTVRQPPPEPERPLSCTRTPPLLQLKLPLLLLGAPSPAQLLLAGPEPHAGQRLHGGAHRGVQLAA